MSYRPHFEHVQIKKYHITSIKIHCPSNSSNSNLMKHNTSNNRYMNNRQDHTLKEI